MAYSPLVSIITVSKNAGNAIQATLKSVEEQTYSNIEYILIDGNSTDNTYEYCKQFIHLFTKFISEDDKGLYDAMNKGIALATGDLILFLNAGDHFVCPYSLEAFVSKIKINDEADVYYGRIIWVDVVKKHVISSEHEHICKQYHLISNNFPHPATIYTRSAFDKFGVFNLNYPILADYEWNLRALIHFKAKFRYVNSLLTIFYTGGISTNDKFMSAKATEKEDMLPVYFSKYVLALEKGNSFLVLKLLNKVTSFNLNKL